MIDDDEISMTASIAQAQAITPAEPDYDAMMRDALEHLAYSESESIPQDAEFSSRGRRLSDSESDSEPSALSSTTIIDKENTMRVCFY